MNPLQELGQAITTNDGARAAAVCRSHKFGETIGSPGEHAKPWLHFAVQSGAPSAIAAMLDAGFNINALRLPEKSSALSIAVDFDQDEVVELLLRRGADVNFGRPLIGALNKGKTPERRLKYVKLLVEHGTDVNRLYDLYGDSNNQFTALDWTSDPAVIAYLREHGAKTAAELKAL